MSTEKINHNTIKIFIILLLNITLLLTGCSNQKKFPSKPRRYSQLQDTGPLKSHIPKNILKIPNAVPKNEPKSKYGNPPSYVVFNKKYYVMKSNSGYKERGLASWYGTKFHGHKTSNGELYDMYKMTAAHKTLPIPTYIKVRNLENGKTVIVKVNDRGPFHGNRILDLSYTAAAKLGILGKGTGRIEIEAISNKTKGISNSNKQMDLKSKTVISSKKPISKRKINTKAKRVQIEKFTGKKSIK